MAQFPNTTAADGIWTLKKVRRAILGDNWPPLVYPDQFFANTVLLLQADDVTDGSQNNTFLDASTNTHTITRNGNVTQGSFSPFSQDEGKWGNYFDGVAATHLYAGTASSMIPSTGDFTIEGWFYFDGVNTDSVNRSAFFIKDSGFTSTDRTIQCHFENNGSVYNNFKLTTFNGTNAGQNSFAYTFDLHEWYHVALTRTGADYELFVNGVSQGTETSAYSTLNSTTEQNWIGSWDSGKGSTHPGYIADFRIVHDVVYTTNFTPPTEPLTAIANTALLTCRSNRFVDVGPDDVALTVNNVEVTPFSPFAPSTAYDPATKGGSGYFYDPGSNMYLDATNTVLDGDYTVEAWVYKTLGAKGQILAGIGINNQFSINASQQIEVYDGGTRTSTGTIHLNEWNHVIASRSGSTLYFFINGEAAGTTTTSSTLTLGRVGTLSVTTGQWTGYLSDVRIIKGTAVYTSAFTPPTAPLTPVSNTELLLNFTNAGIYDGTGRNVLETVGDAQVDTAVAKYGTGSMQFDGTTAYLEAPPSHLFDFGDGDFTIEFWMYNQSDSDDRGGIFELYIDDNNMLRLFRQTGDILEALVRNGGSDVVDITTALSEDQWTHVALVVNNGTMTLYKDGTSVGSDSSFTLPDLSSAQVLVGLDLYATDRWYTGYIDDLRITKGVARYTANFTPPAAKLEQQ